MKTKDVKKGISLIVLIITIIVVIILAAVVILTLSKNNPIESAKEARFKEDVRTFQDELALTVSKQYTTAGGHRDTKITTSDFEKIKEYIPSFSEKYKDKFVIEDDELKYTNVTDQEKEWCDNLNIKNKLYTELEYIESTGEQYIDTGVFGNENLVIQASYKLLNGNNICYIFGACNTYDNNVFSMSYNPLGQNLYRYFIGTRTEVYGSINNSVFCKITDVQNSSFSKNKVVINTEEYNVTSRVPFSTPVTMTIFARKEPNKVTYFSKIKLRSFKMISNERIIREYIPVLDQNNKPALYDKVEGKFYYNQGTGEDFKYKLKE